MREKEREIVSVREFTVARFRVSGENRDYRERKLRSTNHTHIIILVLRHAEQQTVFLSRTK